MNTLSPGPTDRIEALSSTARPDSRITGWIRAAAHLARFVSDEVRIALERRRLNHRLRKQARQLALLDCRTLKDIGLHHSEIGSLISELEGHAASSRRRSGGDIVNSVSPLY
jgi:hypothetical protein